MGSPSASTTAERLDALGRFLMASGPENAYPHLFEMDWRALKPRSLGTDSVTNIAACEDLAVAVVVTRPDEDSPVVHRLGSVTASGVRLIKEVREVFSSAMAVDDGCGITYVAPPDDQDRYTIRSFDPASRRTRTLYVSDEPVGRIAWFDETIIARMGTTERWRIVAIEGGKARNIDVKIEPGEAFHLGRSGWLAIAVPLQDAPITRLHNLADRRELRVEGWTAIAWLPNGNELLVRNDERLALVSVPSLRVQQIGRWTHHRIWSGTWSP